MRPTERLAFASLLVLVGCASTRPPPTHGVPPQQTDASQQIPGRIIVDVEGIPDARGQLYVELYDAKTYFRYSEVLNEEIVPVTVAPRMHVALEHVPAGRYIVVVSHDANSNAVLDTGVFGVPTEAYGFSRGARGLLGPPDFEAGAFNFDGGELRVAVALK